MVHQRAANHTMQKRGRGADSCQAICSRPVDLVSHASASVAFEVALRHSAAPSSATALYDGWQLRNASRVRCSLTEPRERRKRLASRTPLRASSLSKLRVVLFYALAHCEGIIGNGSSKASVAERRDRAPAWIGSVLWQSNSVPA